MSSQAGDELFGAQWVRLFCSLVELRLPVDVDERLARGKRRALALVLGIAAVVVGFRRLPRATAWHVLVTTGRPVRHLVCVSTCAYFVALIYGLPPGVHARLPGALRALPETLAQAVESSVGGAAPRLCRRAVQALLPPVRGGFLREACWQGSGP
mmetsp:Transcript_64470/g.149937  ORF Transcript_64470/g.149937 Transcript_64470/m.149937 type:complete len:155 (+) Transcript_64470:166-630(+)